ncbi:hypothetical protein GA0074696_2414 [Micromonospora purpureochromogenes]|uniref:Uncharacterized protein n=1 Tax=Micromonospora purpureochromogenes TaxID=47872 RepID=A0A1C4X8L7_9ACTN|nr:hypothetical protein [Micromonospora purpureochromogenes]SCF04806.1 hypothetical protein GA0074696_2414 [Micromonospora purpureochromogenes]
MSTFDEYAAAVRQLSVQVREGERGAAAEAERRRRLHAGVAQVGQRLAAQGQRLDQLGEAIGIPPATAAAPDGPDATSGFPVATAAVDPAADSDPGVVLEEARRLGDEADLRTREVEALAARPELLPTWSPAARAVAVYVACAAAGVLLMLVLVVASGVGLVSGFTLGAWICAGLPVLSFAAGWLILGRWGRPALATVEPPRFVPLGFVICVALVPTAYCASLLLVRFLR